MAAAAVSLIIGLIKEGFPDGMIEGSSICFALVIIIVVGSGNNWISEKALADMIKLADKQEIAVFRNSEKTVTIDGAELVVGDLFYFENGAKLPADCLLISGQDVKCFEGELTGEAIDIDKTPVTSENYNKEGISATLLAKSMVTSGSGVALVVAVGAYSVAGVITEAT